MQRAWLGGVPPPPRAGAQAVRSRPAADLKWLQAVSGQAAWGPVRKPAKA